MFLPVQRLQFYITFTEIFFLLYETFFLLIVFTMNSSVSSLSPTPRNGKLGWYDQFQENNFLSNNRKGKMLIFGELHHHVISCYSETWRKSRGTKILYCWR